MKAVPFTLLATIAVNATLAFAFTTTSVANRFGVCMSKTSIFPESKLFSNGEDEPVSVEDVVETPAPPSPEAVKSDSAAYPIDIPSPILLSTSMVLAIMGTGTFKERKTF